uniref:Uncharacterized protein n=1 Tax=Cacopsylla melanoneura TaxID=428564 RepID=A0A8D8VSD0_9HEMI
MMNITEHARNVVWYLAWSYMGDNTWTGGRPSVVIYDPYEDGFSSSQLGWVKLMFAVGYFGQRNGPHWKYQEIIDVKYREIIDVKYQEIIDVKYREIIDVKYREIIDVKY